MNNKLTQYLLYLNYYSDLTDIQLGSKLPVIGIYGRIIRGKQPTDFETLTEDPTQKIVMLIDHNDLHKIVNKSDYEKLEAIGWETDYIARKVNEGFKMKLVIFTGGMARLADWNGMTDLASFIYPDIENDLRKNLPELKSTSFEKLEATFGVKFKDVDKDGNSNPNYMTYDRFLKSARDAAACRAFYYFTIHLRELYTGDGYTRTPQGDIGVKEYAMPNAPIVKLGDHAIVDLDVKLP